MTYRESIYSKHILLYIIVIVKIDNNNRLTKTFSNEFYSRRMVH